MLGKQLFTTEPKTSQAALFALERMPERAGAGDAGDYLTFY
jgi:hypothetical protein